MKNLILRMYHLEPHISPIIYTNSLIFRCSGILLYIRKKDLSFLILFTINLIESSIVSPFNAVPTFPYRCPGILLPWQEPQPHSLSCTHKQPFHRR